MTEKYINIFDIFVLYNINLKIFKLSKYYLKQELSNKNFPQNKNKFLNDKCILIVYLDFLEYTVNYLVQHLHVTALSKNVPLLYATL